MKAPCVSCFMCLAGLLMLMPISAQASALFFNSFSAAGFDPFTSVESTISGSFTYDASSNSIASVDISGTLEPFAADFARVNGSLTSVFFYCGATCQSGHHNPHDQWISLDLGMPLTAVGDKFVSGFYSLPSIYGKTMALNAGSLTTVAAPLPPSFALFGSAVLLLLGLRSPSIVRRLGPRMPAALSLAA
jgi:hypothetical protein